MGGTLLQPAEYDPGKERRNRILLIVIAVIALIAVLGALKGPEWVARWKADQVVKQFFSALESKDFEKAYGIWIADPEWKQHPQQHQQYGFSQFYVDWGPSGSWGAIQHFKIDGSAIPERSSTSIVVQVTINDRLADKAQIWVDRRDKTLTEMPR